MPIDQFCLMRSHVVAAVVAFSVLSITQLFILLNCLHSRCAAVPDNVSCSSTGKVASRRFTIAICDKKCFQVHRPI
ncbi:unnamed protein product [Heligmosomoides polygyrus]|uniref:Secreted protein n=1 Tax=Heligmosomoides polygyrus TaxID=6339 RepID=A0A183GU16_HELPZ|nr:unnamed protein product [Heligmosomoides polygyrus]